MFINQLCQNYIAFWEQENLRNDFCLRFPHGGDFISYLYQHQRSPRVMGLLKTTDGCQILEDSLQKHLSEYVSRIRQNISKNYGVQ